MPAPQTDQTNTEAAAAQGVSDGAIIADGDRWYVVHTQPHAEMRTIGHLERQGFAAFCPCTRRVIRHARKQTPVQSPLFPNYVFVRFNPASDQWRCINGTRGAIRLIAHGEVPSAVPEGVVESLQLRMGADGVMDWTTSLKAGDQVKVTEGPFADLIGTLEHLDTSGRVRVLLDLLGRSVSVIMHSRTVMPKG